MIKLSIYQAALECGVSREALARAMVQSGVPIKRGEKYPLKAIIKAMSGDIRAERLRLVKATADKTELANRITAGEMISVNEAREFIQKTYQPVREMVVAMPSELCAQVNPSDPHHALGILKAWAVRFLKSAKEHKPNLAENSAPQTEPTTNHE